MITCRECAELLMDFVEGALSPEDKERFRAHLDACPPCIAYIESYQITIQLTRQLTCGQLPPEVAARLQSAIEEKLKHLG